MIASIDTKDEDLYPSFLDDQPLTLGGLVKDTGPLNFSGRGSTSLTVTPSDEPPPEMFDTSELVAQYEAVPQRFNPRRLLKSYDSALGESRAATQQQGNNAMRAYANRLMQMGVAPVASGVVGAQARRAGNANSTALLKDKETIASDMRAKAAGLQASIASNLASLRDSYTKTLADYNARQSSLKLNADQFNSGQGMRLLQMAEARRMQDEATAASSGAEYMPQDVMTPGYIPNSGPITPATVNGIPQYGQVFSPASIIAMGGRLGPL